MRFTEIIVKKADQMTNEHSRRVIHELEFDSKESLARTEGMGSTLDILKWINGIKGNWYSFQSLRDQMMFIVLYPISVLFWYTMNDIRRMLNFIPRRRRE